MSEDPIGFVGGVNFYRLVAHTSPAVGLVWGSDSGGRTFVFVSENHLVSMNNGAVAIVYDGDGNRVAKSVTTNGVTVTTRYLVDDLNPTGYPQVVDEAVNGAVQREYTYGLQRISQNQVISGTWTPSFYGYDGFGSVRFLTNAAGTVTDAYEYDAFGNKVASTGTTPNVYLYRGEQYDPDLGLYYLRARYYNSLTGRFLSRDPLSGEPDDPKTLHKYLYAYGDPVNGFDPSGKGIAEGDALFTFPETIADKVLSRTGLRIASCFAGLADAIYGLTHDLGAHTLWGTFWAYFGCIDTFTPE